MAALDRAGQIALCRKHNIQEVIGQQRINLADVAYQNLDHVNSILDAFENPQGKNNISR